MSLLSTRTLIILTWTSSTVPSFLLHLLSFAPVALIVGATYNATYYLCSDVLPSNTDDDDNDYVGLEPALSGSTVVTFFALLAHATSLLLSALHEDFRYAEFTRMEWTWALVFGWFLLCAGFMAWTVIGGQNAKRVRFE